MADEMEENRIETALQAAEDAITTALSEDGTRAWGPEDALGAVSLLVTRFAVGIAVRLEGRDKSRETDLRHAIDFVDMVSAVAKKGCHSVFESKDH